MIGVHGVKKSQTIILLAYIDTTTFENVRSVRSVKLITSQRIFKMFIAKI